MGLPDGAVDSTDVIQRRGFPRVIAYFSFNRQGLIVILQCLLGFPDGAAVDSTDGIQRCGFPRAIAYFFKNRQGLIIICQRFLGLPRIAVVKTDTQKCVGFGVLVFELSR